MSTLFDNPNSIPATNSVYHPDVVVLRNSRDKLWLEIVVYVVVFVLCSFFAGAGIYFAFADDKSQLLEIAVACFGIGCSWALLNSAMKRYEFYRDREAKLTLSKNTLFDHRTGTSIQLNDVASIRFDRRLAHHHESRADLHLAMADGAEHVLDLKELDLCSKEIAWRVKNNTGIEEAEGVSEPTGIGIVGYAIATALFVGVAWQIIMNVLLLLDK